MVDKKLLTWAEKLPEKFTDIDFDIRVPLCRNKDEMLFVQTELIKHGAIPLNKLEVDKTYIGCCRNANEAVWKGEYFIYQRYKFGLTFPEKINHFQNDNGYDVFVPFKLK